jgi:hypothetical protein
VAERLDPEGEEPALARYNLFMLFGLASERAAEATEKLRDKAPDAAAKKRLTDEARARRASAQQEYTKAAQVLHQFLQLDPYDPRLRFQLADALFRAGETSAGRKRAQDARRLDEMIQNLPERTARSLTDRQREQIQSWLRPARPG